MKNFANKQKIEHLKNLVREGLKPHINGDYVLLDVPNHSNIGDTLIWEGELEYLNELEYKCLYSSNIFTHRSKKIPKDAIILFHGGGNFGDVWVPNQRFRNEIIKEFPNNKIIVFPQTVYYEFEENLKRDKEIYNSNNNIVLCVRDRISYEIAKSNFDNCEVLLLPDMAFFNDFEKYHITNPVDKTLIMLREDKEMGDIGLFKKVKQELIDQNSNFQVKDWPGFLKKGSLGRKFQSLFNLFETKGSKFLVNTPFNFFVNDVHGLRRRDYKARRLAIGIEFMNRYDVIYSTRLHGFILAVLLDKKVFIFDNSYGKNKNFFKDWLSDFEGVKLIVK